VTERKPFGMSWETWIDRQIREGMERGDFDGLPGHGKPLADVDRPHDELWWVRDKLRREGVSYLPPTLALRKDVEDAHAAIDEATTEAEVRQIVGEINERIRSVNRLATTGPPSNLMPLDLDRTLEHWAARPPAPDRIEGDAG
jgi:DnaJ homologue, subfamily C, member 28, conserved domain